MNSLSKAIIKELSHQSMGGNCILSTKTLAAFTSMKEANQATEAPADYLARTQKALDVLVENGILRAVPLEGCDGTFYQKT